MLAAPSCHGPQVSNPVNGVLCDAGAIHGQGTCNPDSVTISRSQASALTKRIDRSPNGWAVTRFPAGAWFSVHGRSVASFDQLALLLYLAKVRDLQQTSVLCGT
jgi:hypothetical protein